MFADLILIFFLNIIIGSFSENTHYHQENLHNFMNDNELFHYFHTTERELIPEYEVVYLPHHILSNNEKYVQELENEIEFNFSAFNRPINLKLVRNSDIISHSFRTFIHDENGLSRTLNETPLNCHFLHNDGGIVAALSMCTPKRVQGLIFVENSTFEIQPLSVKLQRITKRHTYSDQIPHIIKKAQFESDFEIDELFPTIGSIFPQYGIENSNNEELFENSGAYKIERTGEVTTVEIALFFDEAAYNIFSPYFKYDDKKLQNMLLAYINGVQALYHHPSLGNSVELIIVRLDIMRKQPKDLPHFNGERSQLLDSFCQYQADINPKNDSNPEHWDMALYISGLDFYAYENGRKNGATMGLATVGGVCLNKYACVIAEFGTTNVFGKPYPSAGFTSVYILAHEIGHNLGMHHDSSGNRCSKEGFIMSPSRGTNGETQWSTCSAEIVAKLGWAKCLKDSAKPARGKDHTRFLDIPGRIYTAKKQCEILLRDKDAVISPNQFKNEICYNLQCKTPNRSGFYYAGPALDGTPCANGKFCYGGICTYKQPPKPVPVIPGGWSNWKKGTCRSECIKNSQGIQTDFRECNNPIPVNTDQSCEGTNQHFSLCKDDKICSNSRISAVQYASKKCKEFSSLIIELDSKGVGLQAPHEDVRIWTGCAIFCKRKDSGIFYTPRIELNDLGVSPYFPDGSWCHQDNTGMNYYCMNHHCLPEIFQFTKNEIYALDDIPFAQNALPEHRPIIPQHFKNYFALSPNGLPIQTSFKDLKHISSNNEDDWESKDYVELPSLEKRFGVLIKDVEDINLI